MTLVAGAVVMLLSAVCVGAPRYPLKSARALHSDAQIARARDNIAKYSSARGVADSVIKNADKWLEFSDGELTSLLTSSDVPRAFAVSASGCPKCGDKIKQINGDYSWIIDPRLPFKITCPVDGTVFPNEDHPDDGWGWKHPQTGEKFWFVAYYNHWMWHKHLVPAARDLAHAYLLTGEKEYAHKSAVMLHRIAEVYPAMDHAKQSRYGQMTAARGGVYRGKVVNAIWECFLAQALAEAYDAVWETIDSDAELHKSSGKTGEQIRAFIEQNVLEEAIDAYFSAHIRGNFGMHQRTLVYLALVRQHGENDKWFDLLMNDNSASYPTLGLNYALYNLISHDGVPMEGAPGYNNIWVRSITDYGELLDRAGRDVFDIPRMRRMYDAVINQINIGQFTPDIGDSGTVWGGLVGGDAETFQTAYRQYQDPRYAAFLNRLNARGEKQFKTFDALFREPIEVSADAKLPPAKPRLLPGFGLAVLNNPGDTISMSLYYGQKHGHGHYDRLNFEIFANGVKIMPDLGYPDAMNDYVPGIYTWSKNTVSHNTVVVNESRQQGVAPGTVMLFADSPFARVIDVDAPQTYPDCSTYRRAMIMVDCAENRSYFVDIFTVVGGKQHDYSLHGPPGEFEMVGGKWSEPTKGTLAGDDVPVGKIYDDPTMGAADYKGGYAGYTGSGFQHLFNVRVREQGNWTAQWRHEKNLKARLHVRTLAGPGQLQMLCEARVSPEKYPQIVRYLITRSAVDESASSHFVSVIEPFAGDPVIVDVKRLGVATAGVVALQVTRHAGDVDVIVYNPTGEMAVSAKHDIWSSAHADVSTLDRRGRRVRWFRAGTPPHQRGSVLEVYPMQSAVKVAMRERLLPDGLIGRAIHLVNERHRTVHTITAVRKEQEHYVLTLKDDILVGLAKIVAVESQALTTSTALPLAPSYRGVTVADEIFRLHHPVSSVGDGKINLASALPEKHPFKAGENVWLMNVGPGDAVEIPDIRWSLNK